MHIYWHGLSCIKLQTGDIQLIINPYQDSVGITMPKLKVDVVVSSNIESDQANNLDRLQGDPQRITNAGEYEIQGVFVYGSQVKGTTNVVYAFEIEGMRLAHVGTDPLELSEEQIALLEGVDVLFLPITGDKKQISTLISHVEPRVIIPIQYATPKLKVELDSLDAFLKEMGASNVKPEPKVILKEKQLPAEETQIIVLDIA